MRTDRPQRPTAARRAAALGLLAGALAGGSGAAWAQTSPWYLTGLVSLTHDSNLLRLGNDRAPPVGQSRSDVVTSTALIAGLDQPLGRQRVRADLTLRDSRYDRNSRYDNQAYSGSVSLDWSTVGRVSGQLGIGSSRALSTFNADGIGLLTERNYETTERLDASVRIGLVTAWSLELGAASRRVRNSLQNEQVQSRNVDQDSTALGLAWRPGPALETSLSLRETRGRYPTFRVLSGVAVDDPFTQRGAELGARWRPAGASQFEARVGSARTRYGRSGDRDFDSGSGSLTWLWQVSGKLSLNTRLAHDKGLDDFPVLFFGLVPALQSDLRSTDTFGVQADWAASAKLAVTAGLQLARRDLTTRVRTTFDGVLRTEAQGIDETTSINLGLRWAPTRWSLIGCDLRHDDRRADERVTLSLNTTSLGCYAQATMR